MERKLGTQVIKFHRIKVKSHTHTRRREEERREKREERRETNKYG